MSSADGPERTFEGLGFLTQKPKEDPASCQDRVKFSDDGKLIVVADGVTTSLQGGKWAELLVNAFVQDPPGGSADAKWLEAAQSEWKNYLAELARKEKPGSTTTTRIQLLEPGAATLVAVRLVRGDAGNFQIEAIACGDSCVLVSRGGRIVYSFPKQDPAEFDNSPVTIKSNTIPGTLESLLQRDGCELEEGDVIFLATDAMAKLLLSRAGEVLEQCLQLGEPAQFRQFVSEQRAFSREALDDDVTLVRVIISATHEGLTIFPSDLVQTEKPRRVNPDGRQGSLPPAPSVPVSTASSPQNEPTGPSLPPPTVAVAPLVVQQKPISSITAVNDAPRHRWTAIAPWVAIVLLAMACVSLFIRVHHLSAELNGTKDGQLAPVLQELQRRMLGIIGKAQQDVQNDAQIVRANVYRDIEGEKRQVLADLRTAGEGGVASAKAEMASGKAQVITELKTEAGTIRNSAKAGMDADENAVVQDLQRKTPVILAAARQEMDGIKALIVAGTQKEADAIRVKAKADMEVSENQSITQIKLCVTNGAMAISKHVTQLSTTLDGKVAKAMTPQEKTLFLDYDEAVQREAFKQILDFAKSNFPDQFQHGPSSNMMIRISGRSKGKDISPEFYSAFCKSDEGHSLGVTFKHSCVSCGDSGQKNDSFVVVRFESLSR